MSARAILNWPDQRLKTRCAPMTAVNAGLFQDMFDTMYAGYGRGLAAPQIGVMQRVFVMDIGWKDGDGTPMLCINPEIVSASTELVTGPEGCLSMPGVTVDVSRHAEISLRFLDEQWVEHIRTLSGFAAICAQHELDHLDGKMHFDRIDQAARTRVLEEYEALK